MAAPVAPAGDIAVHKTLRRPSLRARLVAPAGDIAMYKTRRYPGLALPSL